MKIVMENTRKTNIIRKFIKKYKIKRKNLSLFLLIIMKILFCLHRGFIHNIKK